MNETDIIAAFMGRTFRVKRNGVFVEEFLRPLNSNYEYTAEFRKFNISLLKQGQTNIYVPDNQKIYDRNTNKLVNKNLYYRKKKLKVSAPNYLFYDNQVVFTKPSVIANNSVRYNYLNNFQNDVTNQQLIFRLKTIFRTFLGNKILVKAAWNKSTDFEKEFEVDMRAIPTNTAGYNSWWDAEAIWRTFEYASGESIFDYNANHELTTDSEGNLLSTEFIGVENQGRMVIFIVNNVPPEAYDQVFADGINHCVLTPIKEYLYEMTGGDLNSKLVKHEKFIRFYKRILKWEQEYPVGVGIPIEKLPELCENIKIGIDIYLPTPSLKKNEWKSIRPSKNPRKTFKFINSRLNHLDIVASFDNKNKYVLDNREQYTKKLKELQGKYHLYNSNHIITQDASYSLEDDFIDNMSEFERNNNMKNYRLDYKDKSLTDLNNYIIKSCIYNGCIDFKDTTKYRKMDLYDELDGATSEEIQEWNCKELQKVLDNIKKDNIRHIDMSKAYTRCNLAPEFEGYLGLITDFRKTNEVVGIGLYQITNINFSNCKYAEMLAKLGFLYDMNVYPSPELKYLTKLGVEFEIVSGCWGEPMNIDWGDEIINGEYTGMFQRGDNGVRHFCKWFGIASKPKEFSSWNYQTNDDRFLKHWAAVEQDEDIRMTYYKTDDKYNLQLNIPKSNSYHLAHICSFIYSYQRIMMIRQLLEIPLENIIRVVVDGIYYNECDLGTIYEPFEREDKFKFGNIAGNRYRTAMPNFGIPEYQELAEFRPNNKSEVHTGAGGCGKTYKALTDKGFVRPLYIAHSWKLASIKQKEFNCDVSVVHRLTMDDWYSPNPDGGPAKKQNYWEEIGRKFSVLIIDEVSTLSMSKKKIIMKRFPNHKILWCGDIGKGFTYQCPPIYNKPELPICFHIQKTDTHIHHEVNRRCECDKLQKLLLLLRKIIEDKARINIKKWVSTYFDIIDKNDIDDYKPEDMILARTHKANEFYDKKYKDLEKYYVTETFGKVTYQGGSKFHNVYNGEIHLTKPDIPRGNYRIRHGYTIDCIQGETAYHKLIIDINELSSVQHLYTAVSRAKHLSQIIWVA